MFGMPHLALPNTPNKIFFFLRSFVNCDWSYIILKYILLINNITIVMY